LALIVVHSTIVDNAVAGELQEVAVEAERVGGAPPIELEVSTVVASGKRQRCRPDAPNDAVPEAQWSCRGCPVRDVL